MAFNKDKYISKYIGEASENIATIESALFKLKDGNALEENLVYVLRTLHTLKSSSRMLEFINMESLVHSMENLFVAYKEERIKLTDKIVNLVLRSVDMLKTGIAHIQSGKSDSIEIQEYIGNLNNAAVNEDFVLPAANSEIKNDIKADTVCLPVHEKSAKANDILKEDSIRIPLHKIDQIIKDAASMQMLEMSSRNIHLEVDKMGQSLKNMNKIFSRKDFGSTASVKNDKEGLLIDFKEAEHVNSFLNSKIKNHVLDISQLVGKIYNSILSLRMLPISIILDSYPRYVYEMASGLNKKVKLVIKGKENEIDKNIIEGLSDILLHVIRNAVDHGIETPEERKKKGKDETGLLTIECSREHGNMKIVISDDGRGISEEKIRSKIIAMKLVDESIARSLSKTELINYIFESGFSTADQVSNISGRGVGMDVVKSKIEEMKGSISIDTEPDNGSKFNLVVPLSIASVLGFEVSAGNLKFIIPANYIETTMICTKEDFIENLNTPVIRYNNSMIKLFYLHQILETEKLKTSGNEFFVVIINSYQEIMALVVDSLSNMKSVILKNMPAHLNNVRIFSGIVLNENYEFIPVFHMPALMKKAKGLREIDVKKRYADSSIRTKNVLVVDDSPPTREVLKDILESEGYKVMLAPTALQALDLLKTSRFELICTDLNMPQMDGFVFIENLKKFEKFINIPIIVISARDSETDRSKALALGANRYIVKSSFHNNNLVHTVKELIGEA